MTVSTPDRHFVFYPVDTADLRWYLKIFLAGFRSITAIALAALMPMALARGGPENAVCVGWSAGGMVAFCLAMELESVDVGPRAVNLLDPFGEKVWPGRPLASNASETSTSATKKIMILEFCLGQLLIIGPALTRHPGDPEEAWIQILSKS
jgi:thioesterase domain-containing protein